MTAHQDGDRCDDENEPEQVAHDVHLESIQLTPGATMNQPAGSRLQPKDDMPKASGELNQFFVRG